MSTKNRIAEVKRRVLAMVRHAEDKYFLGVRFFILSQKLNSLARGAGVPILSILEEMDADGEIFIYTDENFSKLIMAPEVRATLTYDALGGETEETKNIIRAKWGKK